MSSIQGGITASIAAQAAQTSGRVQAIKPVARQNNSPNIGGLLNGSANRPGGMTGNPQVGIDRNAPIPIGAATPKKFGALTLGGSAPKEVAAIGEAYKKAPQAGITEIGASYKAGNPQQGKGSTQIGQLLAGGFGNMTTQGRQAQPQTAQAPQAPQQVAQNGLIANDNVKSGEIDNHRKTQNSAEKDEKLAEGTLEIMAAAA